MAWLLGSSARGTPTTVGPSRFHWPPPPTFHCRSPVELFSRPPATGPQRGLPRKHAQGPEVLSKRAELDVPAQHSRGRVPALAGQAQGQRPHHESLPDRGGHVLPL